MGLFKSWNAPDEMTLETTVILGLIIIWVLPPVLIILYVRSATFYTGCRWAFRLCGISVDAIAETTQRNVEAIRLAFDEEAKARRQEMIERDKIQIEVLELRKELDLAELKANEYWLRIGDPARETSKKKLSKKARRFSKSQEQKRKKQKASPKPATDVDRPELNVDAGRTELHIAFATEVKRVDDLREKIAALQYKIHQLDNDAVLRETQASLRMHESILLESGDSEGLDLIEGLEISIFEKERRLRALVVAQQETREQALQKPSFEITAEQFRSLVELEKVKILEQQAKLPTREELDKIEKLGTELNRSFLRLFSFHRIVYDFLAKVDPDTERVFGRMRHHYVQATEAHQNSILNEIDMRASLISASENVSEYSQRIANSDPMNLATLTSTQTTLEATALDLEAALNSLSRKNKANEARLFEVALVIERLEIIRSMLTVLPVSLRDTIDSITHVVNAGCALLINQSLGNRVIEHIDERLAKLEGNAIMACIKIAKGERKLKGRELTQLLERLNLASAALTLERQRLVGQKDRLDSDLNAIEETEQERRSTITYRRDCYGHILATVDRTLDVMSVMLLHSSKSLRVK